MRRLLTSSLLTHGLTLLWGENCPFTEWPGLFIFVIESALARAGPSTARRNGQPGTNATSRMFACAPTR